MSRKSDFGMASFLINNVDLILKDHHQRDMLIWNNMAMIQWEKNLIPNDVNPLFTAK